MKRIVRTLALAVTVAGAIMTTLSIVAAFGWGAPRMFTVAALSLAVTGYGAHLAFGRKEPALQPPSQPKVMPMTTPMVETTKGK